MEEKPSRKVNFQTTASSSSSDLSTTGNTYVLLVGIDEYADPEIPNLNNAVRDVQAFQDVLMQHYEFEEDDFIRLFNGDATRTAIYQVFRDLRSRIKEDVDNLIVYYSGHGHWDESIDIGYWLPTEARKGDEASFVENTSIVHSFIRPNPALHIILIMDSCYAGSIFPRGEMKSSPSQELYVELSKRKSRWALCSGRSDQEVSDGTKGGHSPFAENLLDFLRQTDRSSISISEIAQKVKEVTQANIRQIPRGEPLFGVGHKGGEYVFRRKGSAKTYQIQSAFQSDAVKQAWQEARLEYSIPGFLEFLGRYPQVEESKEAIRLLNNLTEELQWQLAKAEDSVTAYQEYIETYPEGRFVAEARTTVILRETRTEEEILDEASQSTESRKYEEYLSQRSETITERQSKTIEALPTQDDEGGRRRRFFNGDKLKKLISRGSTEIALETLQKDLMNQGDPELENDVILIKSKMNQLNQKFSKGLMQYDEYSEELSRVNFHLLNLISKEE